MDNFYYELEGTSLSGTIGESCNSEQDLVEKIAASISEQHQWSSSGFYGVVAMTLEKIVENGVVDISYWVRDGNENTSEWSVTISLFENDNPMDKDMIEQTIEKMADCLPLSQYLQKNN
tara:strand:- start:95 stop:451 length:357 start_codon:yes stop_codon:yes gene_type:complete